MGALDIHRECYSVGSHSPALLCAHNPQVCHDHGRYFSQWNLSRGDMPLPNGSGIFCPTSWNGDIMTEASGIFCPTSWNGDIMTEAGAAMLDQR